MCCVLSGIKMGYIKTPQYDSLSSMMLNHRMLGKKFNEREVGDNVKNLLKR
jgi:hypothetical protein